MVQSLERLDHRGRVAAYPLQKPGVPESVGLTREECSRAAWAVAPDGRRYRGAAAVHAALAWALSRPRLLDLYYLPGLHQLEDLVYALVAASRSPGTTPYCRQHPDECSP